MCGITGFYALNKEISTENYYKSHLLIKHRGPDDEGFSVLVDKSIKHFRGDDSISNFNSLSHINGVKKSKLVFGHRRLSIIDLSYNGHQPFEYDNLILTYNGEIYNYIELRVELKQLGYSFETESDTEVFLKAFHCWGKEAFNKFNGMWAAAIYNSKTQDLILTRDRFGIKPLYYAFENGVLYFASEIKFIINYQPQFREVDKISVFDFITYGQTNYCEHTFFKQIKQLEPGEYLKFQNKLEVKKYYTDSKEKQFQSIDEIREAIEKSIDLHMRSDVPIGISLSGGIDSSVITSYLASKKLNLHTFSSVFPNNKECDESFFIKENINKYPQQIIPSFIELDYNKSKSFINDILSYFDEPYHYMGVAQPFYIYKKVRNTGIKVMIGGQGGDEMFGGYSNQLLDYYVELFLKLKFPTLKKYYKGSYIYLLKKGLLKFKLLKLLYSPLKYISILFAKRIFKLRGLSYYESKINSFSTRQKYFNFGLRNYLNIDDKMSMSQSIECRVPLLNVNVYNSVIKMNYSDLIHKNTPKYLLREAFFDVLPAKVYKRSDKMGYVSPDSKWIKENFNELISCVKSCIMFDTINIKSNIDYNLLWRYYIVAIWYKNYIYN